MQRGATGPYHTTMTPGEAVRAFLPHPLPPRTPDTDPARRPRGDRAWRVCGRRDAVTARLSDHDLVLSARVRREALLPSRIEGSPSSLSDLLLFELETIKGLS